MDQFHADEAKKPPDYPSRWGATRFSKARLNRLIFRQTTKKDDFMTKHTALPWHRNINAKYPLYDDKHNKIAYALYGNHDQPTFEEANANIELIVRAVNAHDELVKDIERIRKFSSAIERGEEPWIEGVQEITRIALEALAKARGEQ